jgi:hypothetical protein
MKILRLLLIVPIFASAALAADTSAPAATPTPPAPEKVVMPAIPVNPADAEAVLNAMHYDEMMSKGLSQQKQAALAYTRQMLTRMNIPGTSRQDLEAFGQKAVDTAWGGLTSEDIHTAALRIYGEIFTADELHAMATFYSSPAGQAVATKLPIVQQKIMAELRPQMLQVMPKIQQLMRDFATQQQAKAKKVADEAAAAKAEADAKQAVGTAAAPTASAPAKTPAPAPAAPPKQ